MTVWHVKGVIRPRGDATLFVREVGAVTHDDAEVDDVDYERAFRIAYAGFELVRVLSCIPYARDGVLVPRRRKQ